jgi:uncharacterized protein YegL
MKFGYTHITLVVDRSGSMHHTRTDAEGGIKTFVDEQKAQPGECSFTLFDFDDTVESRFGPDKIANLPAYSLVPRGSTALYDAMGKAIVATGEFLKALPEEDRPEHVVFVTVTDGQENASREYTHPQIKAMVEKQESDYRWQFVFLASNIDAAKTGALLGNRNTTQYDAGSTQDVYYVTSASVSNLRGKPGGQSIKVQSDVTKKR